MEKFEENPENRLTRGKPLQRWWKMAFNAEHVCRIAFFGIFHASMAFMFISCTHNNILASTTALQTLIHKALWGLPSSSP
jgi:hypothetical protein